MFDYEKFENDIIIQLERTLQQIKNLREDVYFFSLACAEDCTKVAIFATTKHHFEMLAPKGQPDYFSYKYCENEWEIGFIPSKIYKYMYNYMEKNNFYEDDCEIDAYFEHFNALEEACMNALLRFRDIEPDSDIILTLDNIPKDNNSHSDFLVAKHVARFKQLNTGYLEIYLDAYVAYCEEIQRKRNRQSSLLAFDVEDNIMVGNIRLNPINILPTGKWNYNEEISCWMDDGTDTYLVHITNNKQHTILLRNYQDCYDTRVIGIDTPMYGNSIQRLEEILKAFHNFPYKEKFKKIGYNEYKLFPFYI